MKKVLIIGCSGSGKSTFARKLAAVTGLPLHYLDMMWHKPDKTTVSEEEFDGRLGALLKEEKWIIDGNYQRTLEMRLKECDTVFLLDIPVEECLRGAAERIGKQRVDLPWLETELDKEFEDFIRSYRETSLPRALALLEKYKEGRQIIVFKSRDEIDVYLKTLGA